MSMLRRDLLLLATVVLIGTPGAGAEPPLPPGDPPRPGDRYDDLGGDDVQVFSDTFACRPSMDIASNGDIYAAFEYGDLEEDDLRVVVARSQDGGDTWQMFGLFTEPAPGYAGGPSVHVAEGIDDRCFVAYRLSDGMGAQSIAVASSPLDVPYGSWEIQTVMSSPNTYFRVPHITSDAETYDYYYVYLVAKGADPQTCAIWFTRSTNQGTGFETPYEIDLADATTGAVLTHPRVCYGFGGALHVVWYYYHSPGDYDGAIFHRRASSFASGGSSSWDSITTITMHDNGCFELLPQVAASLVSDDVVVAYCRREDEGGNWDYADPGMRVSSDQGVSFYEETIIPGGMWDVCEVAQQPQSGDWIMGGWSGYGGGACLQRASGSDPTTWSPVEIFADTYHVRQSNIHMPMALDPTHGYRAAMLWSAGGGDLDEIYFDAEWRGDPGYPNFEPNFPLTLGYEPGSPPALVDLDQNGDLEIVFGDTADRIFVYDHDATLAQGWPRALGRVLSDGPVAVGPLTWTDEPYIVAGTADGWVYVYDAGGNPMPGWPQDMGTGADTYVSIGALGDPDGRTIVIASDNFLTYRNLAGELPEGARQHWSGTIHHAPCAIGDIDGDGVAEVVCGPDDQVLAWKMSSASATFSRFLPSPISDAITLGDLDLDGEVEVIVPTADGTLYALHEDGGDVATDWPYVTPAGEPLTSGAIAQCLGTSYPEVAVASEDAEVYLIWDDGTPQAQNYPATTYSAIRGAPVIGTVAGSPDIMVGALDERIWSWDNFGYRNPGWPKDLDENIELSPAYGDLDEDGFAEVVVLTSETMAILDIQQEPAIEGRYWPMYGFDAQRTGCANCEEQIPPSSLPDEDEPVASLAFRAATLQPAAEPVRFAFALPTHCAVALEIFDLQGRRVRRVLKTECEAGHHAVVWDGRDAEGRIAPAGPYFGRLRVRGDGRERVLTRKVLLTP